MKKNMVECSCRSLDTQIFGKKIWDVKQVAKYLGCSSSHVYHLKMRKLIPYRKKHGKLRFIPSEIVNWIEEGESTNERTY